MENVLDLRTTPTWERHGVVCNAFSDLGDDESLHVIYEYEPRPLRRRFEMTYAQRYIWSQRRLASERWEVSIRKLGEAADARSIVAFMQRCPMFSGASESTRRALAAVAIQRSVRRKTTIAEQEANWPYLGIVRRGRVFAIVGAPAGRRQILFEAHETDVFGNIVLFDGGATIASFATMADPAELLLFPRDAVIAAAEADARFALALAATATQHARSMAELLHAHVSKKIIARIAAALRPYAPAESGLAAVDPAALPSLRLTQIATAAGTVKEVAARAIAELEKAGVLRRARGRIAFIDRAKLETFLS
jgi:CRP/FNR family transcriptional regulator